MKLGYDLTIEQSQKMVMSHEMLQSIEILQFTNQELENFVENQLLENPFLEEVGTSSKEDVISSEGLKENYLESDSYDDYSSYSKETKSNLEEYTFAKENLWDILKKQLGMCKLDELEMSIGMHIIDEIDESGYLKVQLEEIARDNNVDIGVAEKLLAIIQGFEPSGVGARNVSECLSIQMKDKGLLTPQTSVLIDSFLQEMAQNNIAKVHKETGIDSQIIEATIAVIKTLNPKPGRAFFTNDDSRYITPDVEVKRQEDDFVVNYNERYFPKLRISSYYEQLSSEAARDPSLKAYMSEKYSNATNLMRAIEQRRETVTKVCNVILDFQKDYFLYGEKYLKPMTLKKVSDELKMHESTISRAVHGKYMLAPCGKTIPLKYFFTSGVVSSKGDGVSSNSIKYMIREIIQQEDPKKPYSDQYIAECLNQQSIEISRRTVAKYREAMGIESSSKRKRF